MSEEVGISNRIRNERNSDKHGKIFMVSFSTKNGNSEFPRLKSMSSSNESNDDVFEEKEEETGEEGNSK